MVLAFPGTRHCPCLSAAASYPRGRGEIFRGRRKKAARAMTRRVRRDLGEGEWTARKEAYRPGLL